MARTEKDDAGKRFFFHVNVISDLFKKKFLAYLKQAYQSGKLKFVGEIESLADSNKFQELINKLYNKKWNSYCKKPFGGPEKVLRYLGRYSHRVASANHRIVKLEDSKVTFKSWATKDKPTVTKPTPKPSTGLKPLDQLAKKHHQDQQQKAARLTGQSATANQNFFTLADFVHFIAKSLGKKAEAIQSREIEAIINFRSVILTIIKQLRCYHFNLNFLFL